MYAYSLDSDYNPLNRISYFRNDVPFLKCCEEKLHVSNAFYGQVGDKSERTVGLMDNFEWLVRARFEYEELRVNIFMMHRNKEGKWDLYFGRSELYPHDSEAQVMAYSIWVLRKLNIPLSNNYFILHYNHDYIRKEGEELNYDELIKVSHNFYNSHNKLSYEINTIVDQKERDLSPILKEMRNMDVSTLQGKVRTSRCTRRYKCPFYDICWPREKLLPDNSILHLVSSEHKYEMFEKGIRRLKDADPDLIEGTRQQYAQIRADRRRGLYVDYLAMENYMESIRFPLYFMDFEWDTYAVPLYGGMRPFDVALFQYSLHRLDEKDGELQHSEYIGVKDCRKELLKHLLADIGTEGSIVTFNGVGAEEIRMRELAQLYPEYGRQIENMIARMVDFSLPFAHGLIYHTKMRGLYSLKQIVEIFGKDNSYQNLDISKAMNAVAEWRIMEAGVSEEEEAQIRKNLSAYCGMDTYSLYLVYNWFNELLEEHGHA